MNSKNRQLRLIMLALMLIPFIGVYAQVNEITLSKPGKLSKELGKSSDTITTLKINGTINGKDIEFLVSLPKLTSLDLGNASINEDYTYPYKSKIELELLGNKSGKKYSNRTVLISGSRFLDKLVLPSDCNSIAVLPRTVSDDNYALPYFKIGTLVAKYDDIDYVESSRRIVTEVLDSPRWPEEFWAESWAKKIVEQVNPCIIKSDQRNYSLNKWSDSIDDLIIACNRHHITEFKLVLPAAFSSVKCGDTLDLRGINIGSLCKEAFSGCKAKYVIMPESIKNLSQAAFNNSAIETVEYTSKRAPMLSDFSDGKNFDKITMLVPDGCLRNYLYGDWEYCLVKEKHGVSEYEFTVDKPGTLGNFLTVEITKTVERLTLKGAIYDTDVQFINECKNLTYLDLTYCFVAKSPQTIQREQANREFQAAVFQMLGEMAQENAQNQYEQGNISYGEAMNSVVWGEYAKQVAELMSQDKVEANDNCICPKIDLWKLKEYHMPIQARIIDLGSCQSLEKVILPPKATAIQYGAFRGCGELKELNFPSTLIRIGGGAFYGCKSLEVLNFSKSQLVEIVESRDGTFEGCENLKAVAFPTTFQRMTESTWKSPMCHWYFLSKEKPQYVRVPDGIVHIPKGCINGWRALANDQHIRLVDDIEIVDK